MSVMPGVAELALAAAKRSFDNAGLLLHEVGVSSGVVEVLGTQLDGRRLRTSLTPKRLWRVRDGIRYALGLRGGVSGRELEVLLGHCTVCGLISREILSIFHTCYRFVRCEYWKRTPVWSSACAELE